MNIQKQRDRFDLSFYKWSLKAAIEETQNDFPFLRRIKSTYTQSFLEVINSYPSEIQLDIIRALVYEQHEKGATFCSDSITTEQLSLKGDFQNQISSLRRKYILERLNQDSTKKELVSKLALKNHVKAKLGENLGILINESLFKLHYQCKLSDWCFETLINLNPGGVALTYGHSIYLSEAKNLKLTNDFSIPECWGMGIPAFDSVSEENQEGVLQTLSELASFTTKEILCLLEDISAPQISTELINIYDAIEDFQLVKKKFNNSFYQWSILDALREARSNFSITKRINNADALGFLSLVETLDEKSREDLALSLVNNAYSEMADLNDTSQKQYELLDFFLDEKNKGFRNQSNEYIAQFNQVLLYRESGERIKKSRVKSLIKQELQDVLGKPLRKGADLSYSAKIGDWCIETLVDIDVIVTYSHVIYTDNFAADILQRSMVLTPGGGIDFLRWLGVGSTGWLVTDERSAIDCSEALRTVCSHFYDHIHTLLPLMP